MKRAIVVFGVLAAFLFTLSGAYAVENSTWGRIKATFSESPSKVSGDLSSTGPQFLRSPYRLAKTAGSDESFFYAEKLIKAKKGGELVVGDKEFGKSKLIVPEDALSEDKVLSMKVPKYGDLTVTIAEATFREPGTVFAKPAKVELSYKGVDLTGIDEESLCAWYWNEDTGQWENMGGEVNTKEKQVIFYIDHFSRYGLAPR